LWSYLLQFDRESVNKKTDLKHKYSGDENADDVNDSEKKAECAEDGGLSRHVTTIHKLVVVVSQLSTVQRRVLSHLDHTHTYRQENSESIKHNTHV